MEFACTKCSCRQRCSFPDGAAACPGACSDGCRSKSFIPILDSADTVPWQRIRLQVLLVVDFPLEGQACACSRPSTEAHGLLQCSASTLGNICASLQLEQGLMTQDLMPLGSAVAAERMSTVEIELHGSLAGGCAPGNTVTCVGLVKVLKTETATGDLPFLAFQASCECA